MSGYVDPSRFQEAMAVDLLSYMQRYDPGNVVRVSGKEYRLKTHDSLRMSNGLWHWHSQRIGGRNAVGYLVKVEGMSYIDAVHQVLDVFGISARDVSQDARITRDYAPKQTEERVFKKPELNADTTAVKRYLTGRSIDQEIVQTFIDCGLIADVGKYHTCLFLGYDHNHEMRYGAVRGIRDIVNPLSGETKRFIGDWSGSDKRYSFRWLSDAKTVHVFEAAIDLLSYATLVKMAGYDWSKFNYLSLAGVSKGRENNSDSDLPIALKTFLNDNPQIQTVVLHLDNDEIGRGATQSIQSILEGQYIVKDMPPKVGKDVNDMLRITKPQLIRSGYHSEQKREQAVRDRAQEAQPSNQREEQNDWAVNAAIFQNPTRNEVSHHAEPEIG